MTTANSKKPAGKAASKTTAKKPLRTSPNKPVSEPFRQQCEAHVQFELERLRNGANNGFLAAEVALLWATVGGLTLNKLLDQEALADAIERHVTTLPVTAPMLGLISSVATQLIEAEVNKQTVLADLVTDETRQALVSQALELTRLREDIIHSVVNNPLYADTVAELLYHGIRDYVAAGSELTKKVPGMGSLMSRGGDLLGKRMEGLEHKIEEKVRGYITSNMHKILNRSESMLKESLTVAQLNRISDEVWREAKQLPPRIDGYVTNEQIQGFTDSGAAFWQHLRQTDYFKTLLRTGVKAVYAHAGRKKLANWLDDIGISQQLVTDSLQRQWPQLLPALESSGYLEQVVRSRLEPFYQQL